MNKFSLLLIFVFFFNAYIFAEEATEYQPTPIIFKHIDNDTLDNYIQKKGKTAFLHQLDSIIGDLSKLIKFSTANIKDNTIAFELKAINQHFKLGMDSMLYFPQEVQIDSGINRVYGIMMGNTKVGIQFIEAAKKENVDFNKVFQEEVYKPDVRAGLYIFCNYLDNISEAALDTLYHAALVYPNNSSTRVDFYYALSEFDRNCGNPTNNSKYYKDKLYEQIKDNYLLEKALSDTNKLNSFNYSQYNLTQKYRFLAYSLYSKNFEIKNNQKEIVYLLSSQNSDGGFKEYNIASSREPIRSKIEPTIYAFWALLEFREQINKIYE